MTTNLRLEEQKVDELEKEIKLIQNEIQVLSKNEGLEDLDPELNQLLVDNTKLKYQLVILNRAIEKEKSLGSNTDNNQSTMLPILEHLQTLFSTSIATTFPTLTDAPTIIAAGTINNPKFGDYQCNSAIAISQLLKKSGTRELPVDIANKIINNLKKSSIVARCEVAGAGFINIYLNRSYGVTALTSILKDGVQPPQVDKCRVVVDFSSPNIAKQMHVGHLRSTIIGESICRLLEFLGHSVLRLNHVGDWGTQFGMLIAHLEDRFPNYAIESPPIEDLQTFYKESKARFDSDEEFKKRAYLRVVQLQSNEPNCKKAWDLICDVSRKDFQQIYNRLNISVIERGESFYQSRMEDIVKDLDERKFLEEDNGRKIMWGDVAGEGIPLTVVKSDGGFTYDTSDLATIKQRLHEEHGDWIVYVTDAGQATHFKSLFACAHKAGILDWQKHRVDHVTFGVVLGEDGKKFKTRSGDTVRLNDLLDEGLNRAMDKLKEKERDKVLTAEELKAAQESVAYGCIKYADLCRDRNSEYIFSFDRMLEDKGNTAVYLLYAYTRIKSIARNCGGDYATNIQNVLQNTTVSIEHEKEWKLAKVLLKFPDVINKMTNDLCLHHLCTFVYDVSTTFTEFYDSCYCIEKDKDGNVIKINGGRVLLAEATALILKKCFDILGLKPVEKI